MSLKISYSDACCPYSAAALWCMDYNFKQVLLFQIINL